VTAPAGTGGRIGAAIEDTLDLALHDASHSNSFAQVLADRAMREADEDDARREPERSARPLTGVAVGIKELFDVEGAENSYGSRVRQGMRAVGDAEVVASLRRAGAVVVGTTRSHEFGWGITTQHHHGAISTATRNPWNTSMVPGGSSGGSAAAVARGLVPIAVGSDTGGSIRIPAAFCGVLGLKTTYGRLSRRGGVALAPSFDSPGLLARDASLMKTAFLACTGEDPADPATEINRHLYVSGRSERALRDVRVGVDAAQRRLQSNASRSGALENFVAGLLSAGLVVTDVEGPDPAAAYQAFVPYQMAEAFDVHHRILGTYPAAAELYGSDVRARLEAASRVTATDYIAARSQARALVAQYLKLFTEVDVVISVVGMTGPSTIDDPDVVHLDGKTIPLRDSVMPTTVVQNLAGLPSVTFPHGFDDGIPIGLQLAGPPNSELFLLDMVSVLQASGLIHVPRPPTFVHEA
jgi:aspartyl-tRNA(Asn)/glutamyl-tRNA(Gln) amidotransferase subunit A